MGCPWGGGTARGPTGSQPLLGTTQLGNPPVERSFLPPQCTGSQRACCNLCGPTDSRARAMPPTPGAGFPTGWWEERGDDTDGASPMPGAVLGAPEIHPVTLHCLWDGITEAISQTREQHLSKAADEGGEGPGLW